MSPHESSGEVSPYVSLRPGEARDCELLWRWRNEESTRKWSFQSDPIPYEEHSNWFSSKLNDPDSLILIISDKNQNDIGQVRFDIVPDRNAEINISISERKRVKGYGSTAIKLACQYAVSELKVTGIIAYIKVGNEASIKAFTKAGFVNKGVVAFKGYQAIRMIWKPQSLLSQAK